MCINHPDMLTGIAEKKKKVISFTFSKGSIVFITGERKDVF